MEDESITAKLWGYDGSCMELTKFVALMRSVMDGLREEVCLKFFGVYWWLSLLLGGKKAQLERLQELRIQ
jgi:hypothetical protein